VSSPATATASVPTGNTFDKYGSSNPVVRRLMAGFERSLEELFAQAEPTSVLDVGCGEGILSHRWASRIRGPVVGVDLPDPKLHTEWQRRQRGNLRFREMTGERLEFEDSSFDLVAATEVLEHVPAADRVLSEMARVAARHLLVSVPQEPLWRVLNVARGAYLRDLGNTPGHLNHWTRRAFMDLLGRHGRVVEVRSPFPWTMLLVAVS
jgi:2-polyprenyl-3-methyl-5-hydroxy-6-metoxy-1,4-benzoquinol methylase